MLIRKNIYISTVFFLLLIVFTNFAIAAQKPKAQKPKAQNGILDLTSIDLEQKGIVDLEGEWKFIWMQDSPEFARPDYNDVSWDIIDVPGYWNNKTDTGTGYAWYRLTIKIGPAVSKIWREKGLSLYLGRIHTAVDLYINGKKVITLGQVSKSKIDSFPKILPQQVVLLPKLIKLSEHQDSVVVAVRISNYHHNSGGLAANPKLGLIKKLSKEHWDNDVQNMIVLGILLMMFIYHMLLWFGRREDKASLFFALFCLCVFMRKIATDNYFELFWPATELYEIRFKMEYLTIFPLQMPIFALFLHHLFPKEISKRFLKIIIGAGCLIALLTLLTNSITYSSYLFIYQIALLGSSLWLFFCISMAIYARRESAWLVFGGSMILILTIVNDMLYANEIIRTAFLTPVGLVVFILLQSAILSSRFANAHRQSNKLSRQLGEVHRIGVEISKMQNLFPLLEESLKSMINITKIPRGVVYLYDDKDQLLKDIANHGYTDRSEIESLYQPGKGIIGKCFINQQTMVVDFVHSHEMVTGKAEAVGQDTIASIAIPLKYQDEIFGVIILQNLPGVKKYSFNRSDIFIAETLSTNITIQVKNIELLKETAEKARMDQELRTAQAVQKALFPSNDFVFKNLDVAGFFCSASETGGDWYGYLLDGEKYSYILIGDVTGHGTPAALVTSGVRSTCSILETLKQEYPDIVISPKTILRYLNNIVTETGQKKWTMTFFVARYDNETKEMVFANAGHNFPFYYSSAKNAVKSLLARGNRLGNEKNEKYWEESIQLNSGDKILFYTDGIIECTNEKGVEYGKRRIKKLLTANQELSAEKLRDKLVKDAFGFFGEEPRADDVTLVVVNFP